MGVEEGESVMAKKVVPVKVPRFKSESDEADWWYENRALVENIVDKHGKWVGKNIEVEVALKPAKLISIRLPEPDLTRAKEIAAEKGMPYQTYLRSLVHQGLADEMKRRRPKTRKAGGRG